MQHSSLGSVSSKRRWCPFVSVSARGYSRECHRDMLLQKVLLYCYLWYLLATPPER